MSANYQQQSKVRLVLDYFFMLLSELLIWHHRISHLSVNIYIVPFNFELILGLHGCIIWKKPFRKVEFTWA